MGIYFARISEGDKPDMTTGLTPRQKKAIKVRQKATFDTVVDRQLILICDYIKIRQENWESIYRDVKGNGTELLVRYIQANPEYKNLFQSLKEVKVRDVGRSHKFRCHAAIVMQ